MVSVNESGIRPGGCIPWAARSRDPGAPALHVGSMERQAGRGHLTRAGTHLKGRFELRMTLLKGLIASFSRDDEGQGLAEYALILALIAIIAIVALIFLGTNISTILSTIGASV